MLAFSGDAVIAAAAAVVVSLITLGGVIFSAVYARKAAKRSETSNGKTQAQIVEALDEKVDQVIDHQKMLGLLLGEHIRNHEEDAWL